MLLGISPELFFLGALGILGPTSVGSVGESTLDRSLERAEYLSPEDFHGKKGLASSCFGDG